MEKSESNISYSVDEPSPHKTEEIKTVNNNVQQVNNGVHNTNST